MSTQSLFQVLGEEDGIRRLVDTFYDAMSTDPLAAGILSLHPQDLSGSREKLRLFLTGWSGGPQLYIERFGHPRLRARHLPFSIGTPEAQAWMGCMRTALAAHGLEESVRAQVEQSFAGVAAHMRNRAD